MKILPCDPYLLPFEAMQLLEAGCKKTDNDLWELLKSDGAFYVLYDDGPKGVLYFEIYKGILNLVLLVCPEVMKYKEIIPQFVKDLMKSLNINALCIIGRRGWDKLFTELTPIGMMYTYTQ